jgi:hypothetical protein
VPAYHDRARVPTKHPLIVSIQVQITYVFCVIVHGSEYSFGAHDHPSSGGVHIQTMFDFHRPYKSESLGISRIHSEDGLRISWEILTISFPRTVTTLLCIRKIYSWLC